MNAGMNKAFVLLPTAASRRGGLCGVANFLYFFVVLIATAKGIANGMGSTRAMG
ncbi:hypothetical protein [Rhizobium leguminosarum]|uniref:hypothetical protein n=1 Tax=Rhizobium leguminosarum TaxID=384 RepID=UPI0013F16057|nr:hypothetical protein [Rhizobium leguminosarum]